MKNLILYASLTVMLLACTQPKEFTLTGTIEGNEMVDSAFIKFFANRSFTDYLATPVVDGKFTFKGNVDSLSICYLILKSQGDNQNPIFMKPFCLEPGKITFTYSSESKDGTINGTLGNDCLQSYYETMIPLQSQLMSLWEQLREEELTATQHDSLNSLFEGLKSEVEKVAADQVEANIGNLGGYFLLTNHSYSMKPEVVLSLIPRLMPELQNKEIILKIKESCEVKMKTAVGSKFVDFEMNDPEGNAVQLSDFIAKNKLTLIDFWASWCGPCRAEMPSVVAAYAAYKDKGFGIVGVSLDKDVEAWKKSIEELQITWPQMSDLQGWANAGAKLYGINSIPSTVLVDENGIIIAKDLRGDAILTKLQELLK